MNVTHPFISPFHPIHSIVLSAAKNDREMLNANASLLCFSHYFGTGELFPGINIYLIPSFLLFR